MNCNRCHHTDEAHVPEEGSRSLVKLGQCKVTYCTCRQYVEPIREIDEDLM